MRKILQFTCLIMALTATAQDYEWQWAKRGGGIKRSAHENETAYGYDSEQIFDIAVDEENNYYYLAFITQQNTEFDGTPITVYNPQMQSATEPDILLISTDCEGTLRWTQTIGGGGQDYAYNIQLDNNGGLYLGANVLNISNSTDEYLPPHFSPTDAMPVLGDNTGGPQEGYKTAALLKYNTNDGSLAWRVMPQGDVTMALRYAQMHNLQVQPDGTVHALIGFAAGTHLNGQLIVPENFNNMYKYHIVQFDANGEVLNILPLSLEGVLINESTSFRYDAALQRYYVGGMRNDGGTSEMIGLSFNGIPFTEQSFILAFSSTGEEIWRKETASSSDFYDNRINDIEVDNDSDLYITGKYFVDLNNPEVSLGDYQFPVNIGGNINYSLKINPQGEVQWISVPTSYSETADPNFWSGSHLSFDIVINGEELAIATQVSDETWGSVSIDRPPSHLSDPGLLRLNKDTGAAIALNDIMTSPGTRDALTAVAIDNDGNYITGGFFYNDLFTLDNDNVPTLTKVNGEPSYTDFFVAKLASAPCGTGTTGVKTNSYNNIKVYPNPSKGLIHIVSNQSLKNYSLVNLVGQVLLTGKLQSSQNTISIESLSAGTYILNISTTDGKTMSRKVIKE